MVMTNAEIVAEYRQAAAPLKQISILADENMCARSDIVEILRAAGCELPKIYLPKKKAQAAEPETETAAETKTAADAAAQRLAEKMLAAADEPVNMIVRVAAVEAVAKLLVKNDTDDPDGTYDFREQVRGVLALVREIELR